MHNGLNLQNDAGDFSALIVLILTECDVPCSCWQKMTIIIPLSVFCNEGFCLSHPLVTFYPHRTISLLPTTPLPCTLSPPSNTTRRWSMMCVQAWHPPPTRITSHSIRRPWSSLRPHRRAPVSFNHTVYIPSQRIHQMYCMCVSKARGDTLGIIINVCVFCVCVCTASSSRNKRWCKNNAQCYGSSGGVLLVFALLGLAIWLGGTLCWFTQIAGQCL